MSAADLPPLTEDDVRARVGDRSYALGVDYFEADAIFNQRRVGAALKADCEGRSAPSYRVLAVLGEQGIATAECSCPVGGGGHCKHVAALLLTWIDDPDSFVEVEDVDAALARRSREELVTLVKQMLRRHPDLEMVLEAPVPTASSSGEEPPDVVDPEVYRRQARSVFRGIGYEEGYSAASAIADELDAICESGHDFLEQQRYRSAAAVFQAVADAVIENFELFHDEEGDLVGVVQECTEGLSSCMSHLPAGNPSRQEVLKALFGIYRSDIELGGLDLGAGVHEALVDATTADERKMVAGWVREALPAGSGWSDNWQRQAFGGMLLDLEGPDLDDEAFLRICRDTGRIHDLVDRLLALDKLDDAVHEARQAGEYDLLTLADTFASRGHDDVAERIVEERAKTSDDSRLPSWLKRRYIERGELASALAIARTFLRSRPTVDAYREVRDLAGRLAQWDALRPSVLDELSRARLTALLVQIHLDEGDIARALDLTRAAWEQPLGQNHPASLDLQVARAAEETHPSDAADVYTRLIESIVAHRDRASYGQAAELLLKVRELRDRLGQQQTWERYLADLRSRTRTLRAFRAELEAVGL